MMVQQFQVSYVIPEMAVCFGSHLSRRYEMLIYKDHSEDRPPEAFKKIYHLK